MHVLLSEEAILLPFEVAPYMLGVAYLFCTLLKDILHDTQPFFIYEVLIIVSYLAAPLIKAVVFLPNHKHKSGLLLELLAQRAPLVPVGYVLRDLREGWVLLGVPSRDDPADLVIAESLG